MRLHQLVDLVAAYLLLVSLDTAEANNGKNSKKSNGNGGGKPKIRQGNGVIKPFPGQGNGSSNSRRANLDVSGLGSSLGDKDTIELELLPGQGSRKFKFEEHPGKSKANGQGKSWYGRTERGSGRGMTLNLLESDETNLDGSPIFCGSVLDEEVGMYYQFCPDHNGDTIVVETSEDEFGDEEEAEDELEVINNDHIQRISPSRYRHLLERNNLSVSSYDPSSLRGRRASSITFDDSGSNIDVLILWTHEAECGNAGLDPGCVHTAQTEAVMRARIALAVEEANTAYALSGIDLVLRAVHTYREPTGYVEYDDPDKSSIGSTALRDIATDGDGLMDDVHLKRTQYGADMVALVVNYGGGVAYRSTPTASIGSQFSVTGWVKATGRFTFAHELGHNMGCNHDKGTKNACSTSDINYGYRDPQARFRSIMAYGCPSSAECDGVTKAGTYSSCVRVQRFSNMYSNYPWGDGSSPIGTSTVNNAAHISTYKHIISGFYDTVVCSSSSECDDGNDCTADECLATGHCRHTQIPNCCGNGACEAGENYLSCESDCAQELVTTFNGDSTRRGEMFDVTATNSIDIFGFEIHAEDYGVSRDMEVWTRSGTYQGNGESSSGWTKVLDQTGVVGLGERWGTPLNHFTTPISMAAGETRAFFIYSTVGDLGCTYAEGLGFGTILKYDDNVQVKIGVGLSGYFSGDFTKERSPNVVLKYTTGGSAETLSPVASPTPLPPTAPQDPVLTYVSNGGSSYGMCEGDCDSHDDCQAGLMCYQRSGGDPVPGCVGSDSSSTDYCTLPALNDIGNGLSAGSYELCQGDCDSDEDCLGPNLRCFQRNGYDPVPGCEGGGTGSNNWDYCVLDETVSPTPSPTSAPTPYDNCSSNPCAHGACTDEVGGYTCTCSTGWEGGNCDEDIDECARGTDNCDDNNASCTNSAGSFTCSCNPGFAGDGVTCIDTDECTLGTDNCGSNAFCTNTFGGYTCSCNQGFAGDGITCTDEDECALGTANCHSDASCINTAGSFSCSCNNGFEGDGITCVKITDAPTNSPSAHPSSPPTPLPVISPAPTPLPTPVPSKSPTASPTPIPTKSPVVSTPTNPSLTYVGNGGSNYGMCEGDCDSHADCQQAGLGLMCYQRSGGDPVPGCVGGESDSSSTDYCTLPALNDIGNGLSAGSYELCQGDCDSDEDCFGPNICHQRNGYDPVPGCEGLGTNNYDYCILPPPTSAPVQLPTTSSPTKSPAATNQLTYISNGGSGYGMCEGDCDSHDDCQAGLMCYQRSGGDPVPGCIGSDSSSTDYCTLPTLNDIGNNLSNGSYDLCQGDCDDDSDCKGELLCSQRSGYDHVPGCSGLGRNHWDYCIAPP